MSTEGDREAAKHPTMHMAAPGNQESLAQNFNSTKTENLCPRTNKKCLRFSDSAITFWMFFACYFSRTLISSPGPTVKAYMKTVTKLLAAIMNWSNDLIH